MPQQVGVYQINESRPSGNFLPPSKLGPNVMMQNAEYGQKSTRFKTFARQNRPRLLDVRR